MIDTIDFEKALAIEPNNKSISEELAKLPSPKKDKEKQRADAPVKTAVQRQRLPIEILDEAYSSTDKTPQAVPQTAQKQTASATVRPVAQKPLEIKPPRTNLEFERDWKTYRHRGSEALFQYFKASAQAT